MNSINLRFSCGIRYGDSIYASCRNFNGLYKISLLEKKTEFLAYFDGESIDSIDLHRDIFRYGNLLCFIPINAKSIHIYDLKSREMMKILFRAEQDRGGFVGHLVNETLWLFPDTVHRNMYKVNILTKEVIVCRWEDFAAYSLTGAQQYNFSIRTAYQDERIFLPVVGSNTILTFSSNTGEQTSYRLPLANLWGCYSGSTGLWILADGGNGVYLWDYKKNDLKPISIVEGRRIWNWVVETEKDVYLVPAFGKSIQRFKDDQFSTVLEIKETSWHINSNEQLFFAPVADGNRFWLLPYNSNYLLMVEGGEAIQYDNIAVADGESPYHDYLKVAYAKPCREGERLSLRTFIRSMGLSEKQENVHGSYGKNIWKSLQ